MVEFCISRAALISEGHGRESIDRCYLSLKNGTKEPPQPQDSKYRTMLNCCKQMLDMGFPLPVVVDALKKTDMAPSTAEAWRDRAVELLLQSKDYSS